jgi:hypothetical protein
MFNGSEAGSYLRRMDFVYHSIPGLRVTTKRRRKRKLTETSPEVLRRIA